MWSEPRPHRQIDFVCALRLLLAQIQETQQSFANLPARHPSRHIGIVARDLANYLPPVAEIDNASFSVSGSAAFDSSEELGEIFNAAIPLRKKSATMLAT